MLLIILLNFIALFAFISFCYDTYLRVSKKTVRHNWLCGALKIISVSEVIGVCISIYFPLNFNEALSYSKSITGPALIVMSIIILYYIFSKKNNLCIPYSSIIVLGLTASLFRILSSMQI